MYTILVTDDNELIITNRERIMQRSKLVDSLIIYVPELYKDTIDMSGFTAYMEYILPVSKKYVTENLTMATSTEKEGYLECTLPFDTSLTSEAGNIEIQLTFIKVDLDEDGNSVQYIRKTSTCELIIVPIAAWADIIPDSALTAVDQKLVELQALIKAVDDEAGTYAQGKADNIALNADGDLQLKSNGTFIGDAISVSIPEAEDDDDGDADGVIDLNSIYI